MKFNILCIDNNKLYEKQLYDFIKTKPADKLKSEINPYITTIETDTNNLIKDVYNNLDINYRCDSWELVKEFVMQDIGFAFIQDIAMTESEKKNEFKLFDIDEDMPKNKIEVILRKKIKYPDVILDIVKTLTS